MANLNRTSPPRQNVEALVSDSARFWAAIAQEAATIAHSKRTLFLAYVAEGFNETQALELVRSV